MVFEYVPSDLRKFIKSREKDFSKEEILKVVRQILEALQHCHLKRVLHRDIKPQNILINPDTLEVKLADFGLA